MLPMYYIFPIDTRSNSREREEKGLWNGAIDTHFVSDVPLLWRSRRERARDSSSESLWDSRNKEEAARARREGLNHQSRE